MTAYIMARKSQLAGDIGDPVAAVDMAEAASNLARPGSGLQALAPTYACHGHALQHEDDAARRELDRAHELLLQATSDQASPWAGYAELGRFSEAVEGFRQAIAAVPPSFRRDLGVYLSRESLAHARAGEPEQAADVAMSALYIAEETGSARIMNALLALDDSSNPGGPRPWSPSCTRP